MIPKAEVMAVAEDAGLLPTTVEKDYALGWILFGVAQHPDLQEWIFKGGTCLKKCYFDTYRFSEDLDFTVPDGAPYEAAAIRRGLLEVGEWTLDQAGLDIPEDGLKLEELSNKRGQKTFQARLTYGGPLQLARAQRQRVKFDLTQDEVVLDPFEQREVFHGYSDAPRPAPKVRCYSLTEVLAEKSRALYEREGRARDVYDVVNIGRNFRTEVATDRVRDLIRQKFAFKSLPEPTSEVIIGRIDPAVLAGDWEHSLRHQLPVLPPAQEFLKAVRDVLAELLAEVEPTEVLQAVPAKKEESLVPAVRFARPGFAALGRGRAFGSAGHAGMYIPAMDRLRFAARNRLLAQVVYHRVSRVVEPYSLRMPGTGNLLVYVYEVERGAGPGGGIKAFKVAELGEVTVTARPFSLRYIVEL